MNITPFEFAQTSSDLYVLSPTGDDGSSTYGHAQKNLASLQSMTVELSDEGGLSTQDAEEITDTLVERYGLVKLMDDGVLNKFAPAVQTAIMARASK